MEEEDYMDDLSKFLPSEEHGGQHKSSRRRSGPRPGAGGELSKLPWKERRKLKLQQREEEQRSRRQEEEDVLKRGLAAPIDSSNVGFKLLQKMGFKRMSSSGEGSAGAGFPDQSPVPIELKRNRLGLGREDVEEREREKKRRQVEEAESMRKAQAAARQRRFGEVARDKWQRVKVRRDFKKAASVVLNLLEAGTATCPQLDQDAPPIISEILTASEHFRTSRGIDAEPASEDHPPTPPSATSGFLFVEDTGLDHDEEIGSRPEIPRKHRMPTQELGLQDGTQGQTVEDEGSWWPALLDTVSPEVLAEVMSWLRGKHNYCIFCGHQYTSKESLLAQCPGAEEDDH